MFKHTQQTKLITMVSPVSSSGSLFCCFFSKVHPSIHLSIFYHLQDMLEVLARGSQQDNIICEKQRWNLVAPEPDPLGLWHPTPEAPTECHKGHGRMPSPSPKRICGLVGQTPTNPQAPCGGYRAGPVFYGQDKKNALFLLNPRFNYRPNSPLQ